MGPTARRLTAAAVGLALLGTSGCAKAAEKISEKAAEKAIGQQAGGDAKVDIGKDGKVEIKTKNGSFSAGTGKVPKSWPKDIPLPKSLTVISGSALGTGSQQLTSVGGTSSQSPDELMAYYTDALNGWESTNEFNTSNDGSSASGAAFKKGNRTLQVNAGVDASTEGTTLTVTHQVGDGN